MQTHRCEGIILSTLNFRDYDQIVTVFTKEFGLVKFIAKKSLAPKRGLKCTPFLRGEFIFIQKPNHELYPLRDVSIIGQYLNLRHNLSCLGAACNCAKALLDTQLLHKPAESLYALFIAYLDQFPHSSDPHLLESSFLLKLLRHEGIFESFPSNAPDSKTIEILAFSRSFAEIQSFSVPDSLHAQIKAHYTRSIRQI